ncbi:Imm1 family immunity protein [Gemmata sp.]|uniref:Imm1 family immunity protein n=1 Tax=Gemmata sp. TaxID=1914242 RepID=UPI003F6F2AE6
MEKLYFSPPDGPTMYDALDEVLRLIRSGDGAYWRAGAAHGSVAFTKVKDSPTFALMLTRFGFYVEAIFTEIVDRRRTRVAYVPDANLGRAEVAEPWAGQNTMRIPRDFCLTREQCAEAVRHFCETGGRDPRVNWVDSDDTGWDTNADN